MKFFALFVLLAAAANADKSLPDAMAELRAVLRLAEMGAEWNVFRNADGEVCAFSNQLNVYYPAAFDSILADPTYQLLRDRMINGGVAWDEFIAGELKPALGVHANVPTCTTLTLGGIVRFRDELRSFVDEPLIDATIVRLRGESAEFNELHLAIEASQEGIHRIRCAAPVQQVFGIMDNAGVDLDFVLNVFFGVFLGWTPSESC